MHGWHATRLSACMHDWFGPCMHGRHGRLSTRMHEWLGTCMLGRHGERRRRVFAQKLRLRVVAREFGHAAREHRDRAEVSEPRASVGLERHVREDGRAERVLGRGLRVPASSGAAHGLEQHGGEVEPLRRRVLGRVVRAGGTLPNGARRARDGREQVAATVRVRGQSHDEHGEQSPRVGRASCRRRPAARPHV